MKKLSIMVASAVVLGGCSTARMVLEDRYGDPGRYANALQPQGVIDVQKVYSFRFVDKYRLSHRWLTGTNVRACRYGINVDPPGAFPEILGNPPEPNTPLVERNGVLHQVYGNRGEIRLGVPRERVYGTNPDGVFKEFSTFCEEFFLSSRNGFAVYIIEPHPAKGTDEWIREAKHVNINGLHWLFKEIPPQDMSNSRSGLAADIEVWTLVIPDTPYWLVMTFTADLKYSIQDHYEQHVGMLNLFHRMVESVKLEPLSN